MMTGIITAAREAVIPMVVRGPSGHEVTVDAVIDTGFTGWLTLPSALIGTLRLPFAGTTRATLSDGSEVTIDVYAATVVWDSRDRQVTVLATAGGMLVGMAMESREMLGAMPQQASPPPQGPCPDTSA